MTHEDAGHYAAKHPKDSRIDPAIRDAVQERLEGDRLTCAAAHAIAGRLGVDPAVVGQTLDLMEIRLGACQLGLFGYAPKKKIVSAAPSVPEKVAEALRAAAVDNRVSCRDCWDIADRLGFSKLEVSACVEALFMKVKPCQLGAF